MLISLINAPIFYTINPPFAYVWIFFAVVYTLLYLLIKHPYLSMSLTTTIALTTIYIHMMTMPVFNDIHAHVMYWFVIFPVAIYVFKRPSSGLVFAALFLITFHLFFFFSLFDKSYDLLHIVMVTIIYTTLSVVLFFVSRIMLNNEIALKRLNETLQVRIRERVAQLREKDKILFEQNRHAQMGEMISMIAHQWRQPLSAISTSAASVRMNIELGNTSLDQVTESMNKITDYTLHLSSTIDDFRDFFKPKREKEEVVLSHVLDKSINLCDPIIKQKQITIEREYNEIVLHSYHNELLQVIINIIKNAVDALITAEVPNPKILIKKFINDEAGHAVIAIEDNAGGIPVHMTDKIFDPYFSTKAKNGTGLGLYMSKSIIENHCQGQLNVSNNQHGACFMISLPL